MLIKKFAIFPNVAGLELRQRFQVYIRRKLCVLKERVTSLWYNIFIVEHVTIIGTQFFKNSKMQKQFF